MVIVVVVVGVIVIGWSDSVLEVRGLYDNDSVWQQGILYRNTMDGKCLRQDQGSGGGGSPVYVPVEGGASAGTVADCLVGDAPASNSSCRGCQRG